MFSDNLEAYTLSIVFVGDFNPAIIQPYWLANKKLIREQEAENAKVGILHNEITKFNIDWATIEVTKERFEIRTTQQPYFEPVRDLVIEIFKILKETPVRNIGINHLKYFDLRDAETSYKFGDKIAPLSNWDSLNDPRLQTLEIVEITRKDNLKGHFRVRISPADIKLSTAYSVLININDHLDLESPNPIKIFSENWQPSFQRAQEITESIWTKVNG